MSNKDQKVGIILAHNQDLDGKPLKAGAKASVTPLVARALVARGAAQLDSDSTSSAAKAASKTTADAAEKGGK